MTVTRNARVIRQEHSVTMKDGAIVANSGHVNLAATEGHPAAVMDMSFGNQALSAEPVVTHGKRLERKVYVVPREMDLEIARRRLASKDVQIDELTPAQEEYLSSWAHGT